MLSKSASNLIDLLSGSLTKQYFRFSQNNRTLICRRRIDSLSLLRIIIIDYMSIDFGSKTIWYVNFDFRMHYHSQLEDDISSSLNNRRTQKPIYQNKINGNISVENLFNKMRGIRSRAPNSQASGGPMSALDSIRTMNKTELYIRWKKDIKCIRTAVSSVFVSAICCAECVRW